MQKDLNSLIDQNNFSSASHIESGRMSRGFQRIKRNRPIAFAFVVALSLVLGACGGEQKQSYIGWIQYANDQKKNNDYAGAIDSYNKAVAEADKKYGVESGQTATALGYLGQIYRAQGEWRLAYMTYKRLLPIKEKMEPNTRETKDLKADFDFVKTKIIEYGIKTDDNYGADQMKKNAAAAAKKPKKKHKSSD